MRQLNRGTIFDGVLDAIWHDVASAKENAESIEDGLKHGRLGPAFVVELEFFYSEILRLHAIEKELRAAYEAKDGIRANKLITSYFPGLVRPSGELFVKRPEEIDDRFSFLADEMFRLSLWNKQFLLDTRPMLNRFDRWVQFWIKDAEDLILEGIRTGQRLPLEQLAKSDYTAVFYGDPTEATKNTMGLFKLFLAPEHQAAPSESTPFLQEAIDELNTHGWVVPPSSSVRDLAFLWASCIRSQTQLMWFSFRNTFFRLDTNSKPPSLEYECHNVNLFNWMAKHSIPASYFFHMLMIFLEETNF